MAISYNVYANDGQGGEVDYNVPIATTTGLTYTVGPLAAPSDNTFAVRAFDVVSGIEEANTDARVRIVIDPSGNDVTARPSAVVGLSSRPRAGGTCWVSWGYNPTGQGGPPDRFVVTLTPGPSSSITSPAATIPYLPGVAGYDCTLSGLAGNTPYTIGVQALGALSELASPPATVTILYRISSLSQVDSLVATPTP